MLIISTLIIIIALSIDQSHGSPKMHLNIAHKRRDHLRYKLSENVVPENYTLRIFPDFTNHTFMGSVKILIHVKMPTSYITLHQKNLNILTEKIFLTTMYNLTIRIKDAGISGTNEQEFYTITFSQTLNASKYYLHISEFYGELGTEQTGFYYARYTDENNKLCTFALTQFEATSARQAFPCFDEPSFRAKFKIYIVRPLNYSSISNTKLINSVQLNDNNALYEDEFETTLSMPTYLLAFVVSQMKRTSSHQMTNKFHGIVARPELIDNNYEKYALKLSIDVLKTLESYLNVNYSLNKIDHVAIPDTDFKSGMENWGLLMYKETTLLMTPRTTTLLSMYIDTTIIHEYSHQWFGNLVGIKWWNYLWLKEGFARFFESRILDVLKPELRKMEQFIVQEKQVVLESDSFNNTRELNQDAGSLYEILDLYDVITYRKGASVIHMLETIMTPKIFQHGLTNYLQDRAFKAAVPTDLYQNLQKALDRSTIKLPNKLTIAKIMTTWDSQKGYPLVYVQRRYDKNLNVVKLTQSLYADIKVSKPSHWHIPINYATKSNPNFQDTKFSDWLSKSNDEITIKNLNRDDWLIVNKQEAFYYRVNYDLKNWKLIIEALLKNHSAIHVLNRAQIIDDSFSLSYIDKLKMTIPLELSKYLYNDDDYITHFAFIRHIVQIEKIIRGSPSELDFQKHVIRILKPSYKRLGFNPKANETKIDKLHRTLVIQGLCDYNYFHCRSEALKIFTLWRKQNGSLPLDLEEEIMCNAIRNGSESIWNYLFDRYHWESRRDFKINVFNALGCIEDAVIIRRFLDSSLNSSNPHSMIKVLKSVSRRGAVGAQISRNYFSKRFNDLQSKLGYKYILRLFIDITSHITTKAQLKNFTDQLGTRGRLDNIFEQNLKKTEILVSSKEKRANQISNYFHQMRSGGNLWQAIPKLFGFSLYSLIFTLLCL